MIIRDIATGIAALFLATGAALAEKIPQPPPMGVYPGKIEVRQDLTGPVDLWAWTQMGATNKDRCVIHIRPIGYKDRYGTMTESLMRKVAAHEKGHCFGLIHNGKGESNWEPVEVKVDRAAFSVWQMGWWDGYNTRQNVSPPCDPYEEAMCPFDDDYSRAQVERNLRETNE